MLLHAKKNVELMIYSGFMLLCVVDFCVNQNVQKKILHSNYQ